MLHERFGEHIALDDLAAQAGVSASYLGELFQERTGESVHRYLMRLRIERARALIAQSDRSFTDIALSCGFEDSRYFARVFRQVAYGHLAARVQSAAWSLRAQLQVPPIERLAT